MVIENRLDFGLFTTFLPELPLYTFLTNYSVLKLYLLCQYSRGYIRGNPGIYIDITLERMNKEILVRVCDEIYQYVQLDFKIYPIDFDYIFKIMGSHNCERLSVNNFYFLSSLQRISVRQEITTRPQRIRGSKKGNGQLCSHLCS